MPTAHLAIAIALKLNYEGTITTGANIPEGQPRRCLDTSKAEKEFGFKASVSLSQGLDNTIGWYRQQTVGPMEQNYE